MSALLRVAILAIVFLGSCQSTVLQTSHGPVPLGNDSGQWANDGECDDPRFTGGGMHTILNNDDIRADATDCQKLLEAGKIRLIRTRADWDTKMCRSISYGDNSSQWANDGECDDPRFTGPGTDDIMDADDMRKDANDCRRLCGAGEVWLK